jgi:hypothetical protein
MPQAIEIETQTEQHGLAHLRGQRAARSSSRELAFDRRKQALDQGLAPIKSLRKRSVHLGSYSMDAPGFLSAFGGNDTLSPELSPDVGVVAFAVEFGVSEKKPDGRSLGSGLDDSGQIRKIVPRAAARDLQIGAPDQPRPPTSTNASTAGVFCP